MGIILGPTEWRGNWTEEGHREYKVKYLVLSPSTDGPAGAFATAGLPLPGQIYFQDADFDLYSWCRPTRTATPRSTNQPNYFWDVECFFSTKPVAPEIQRCHELGIEDPLLEIPKLSGGFNKLTLEATYNYTGTPIRNSAHEQVRGPQVEFDSNRPTIKVQFNSGTLPLSLFCSMVDTVNASTLWGLPARTVKLSNVSWDKLLYGLCYIYYSITYEFEINFATWDRYLLDEGTKALNGHWDSDGDYVTDPIDEFGSEPDPDNPAHFVRMKDRNGENMNVVLDGAGMPVQEGGTPGVITVGYYPPADFSLLGIAGLVF